MRKLILALLHILMMSGITFCQPSTHSISGGNKIDKERNGNYEMNIGDTITIDLYSNATTGYSWYWVNQDSIRSLELIDQLYVFEGGDEEVGKGGREVFNIKVLAKGEYTVRMVYKRSWEQSPVEIKEYRFTIR